jgi:predicted membrane chloride channel (bestrophin family)
MWLFSLPVSLVSMSLSNLGVVVATMIATYVLVGIDEVGMEIENCFQLLPLQQLSAAVQNSAEQQIFPALGPMPPVPRI